MIDTIKITYEDGSHFKITNKEFIENLERIFPQIKYVNLFEKKDTN